MVIKKLCTSHVLNNTSYKFIDRLRKKKLIKKITVHSKRGCEKDQKRNRGDLKMTVK
jgi:hypothetical protein